MVLRYIVLIYGRVERRCALRPVPGCACSLSLLIAASSAMAQVNSFPRPSYFRESFIRPATHVELAGPVRLAGFRGGE